MKRRGFGQFLADSRVISEEDLQRALQIQNKNNLLAEIAVELNYIKREDIFEVSEEMSRQENLQFGEAAVSLGLINTNQLRYLLDVRTRRKVRIGDILLQEKLIDENVLKKAIMEFDRKRKRFKKIMVADPSTIFTKVMEQILTQYGYSVIKAKSGEEAFQLAKQTSPDVLMMAWLLPDMDGFELCVRTTSHPDTAGINMIMISSEDSQQNIERAFELGISHFLRKPVNERELINIIYQLEQEISQKREEKILVVDDSRGSRRIIFKELSRAGFQVHMAENGMEAIKKSKELKPDIITMDLEMPEMNGFEACQKIKEEPDTASIPVIIISGRNIEQIREQGFEVGAVEFFTKPFKFGQLSDFISHLLETRKIRKTEKILVVDHNEVSRYIFKYIFNKNGFNVHAASNVKEAMELLPKFSPDLIITECNLPGQDGFQLTHLVKKFEDYKHIPIIMVASSNNRNDVLRGLSEGVVDYILKPFDDAELMARVEVHILNKKLIDRLSQERESLRESENSFKVLTEASFEGVAVLDEGKIININPAFLEMFGYNREEVIGENFFDFVAPEGRHLAREKLSGNHEKAFEVQGIHKSGRSIYLEVRGKETLFQGRTAKVSAIRDITERKKSVEELKRFATMDSLTNVFNRRHFMELGEAEFTRSRRYERPLSLLMMDIDYFKKVNDMYGHATGDKILTIMTKACKDVLRRSDVIGRLGGEEFSVVLPETPLDTAIAVAEKLRSSISKITVVEGNKKIRFSVSIGVTSFISGDKGLDKLLSRADRALYEAKNNGRNQVIAQN